MYSVEVILTPVNWIRTAFLWKPSLCHPAHLHCAHKLWIFHSDFCQVPPPKQQKSTQNSGYLCFVCFFFVAVRRCWCSSILKRPVKPSYTTFSSLFELVLHTNIKRLFHISNRKSVYKCICRYNNCFVIHFLPFYNEMYIFGIFSNVSSKFFQWLSIYLKRYYYFLRLILIC